MFTDRDLFGIGRVKSGVVFTPLEKAADFCQGLFSYIYKLCIKAHPADMRELVL